MIKYIRWMMMVFLFSAISVFSQTSSLPFSDSSDIYVQKIINSDTPVLADFTAVWCGPCKMLAPVIEELKKEYKDKVTVLKIDIDRNRQLASYFKVQAVPSIFLIRDKVVQTMIPGVQQKSVYIDAITKLLASDSPAAETDK